MVMGSWTESQGDRRSLGVNERVFRWRRYGGYGISGSGTVLGGRLVTFSWRNWQPRENGGEGAWKMLEKKLVSRYAHIFLGVDFTFGICRSKEGRVS